MSRKISARTRADAIAICEQRHMRRLAVMAPIGVSGIAKDIGCLGSDRNFQAGECPAFDLAFEAWASTATDDGLDWLEASGLLRDGWCPGDPVVPIGGDS